MKIWKNAIMSSVIAWIFIAALVTLPVSAQATILSSPDIADLNLAPGSMIYVDVTITDVVDLWGYQFVLSFDPLLLTATGYVSHYPFVLAWPSEIGYGYVTMSYSMQLGVTDGFDGTMDVATIEFMVNDWGGSVFDMHDTVLLDTSGLTMDHVLVDGTFANVEPEHKMDLERAHGEHQQWFESRWFTNTLYARAKSLGTVSTLTYAEFVISDESGLMQTSAISDTVLVKPHTKYDFTYTIDRFWLIAHGASPPGYGFYYVHVKVWYYVGGGNWEMGLHTMKFHFTLSIAPG